MRTKFAEIRKNPCPTDRAIMSAAWRRIERKFEADIARTMHDVDAYEAEIKEFFQAQPNGFEERN